MVTAVALVPADHVALTLAAFVVVMAVARWATIPWSALFVRLALAQPFVLGVAVLALFQGRGLNAFVAVALKSTVSLSALQLLVHTTPFEALLDASRRARLPRSLVLVLTLMHRSLFLLIEESKRMQRARAARSFRGGRAGTWRAHASVIAVSFIRSVSRAERMATAMRARGWS
jgi:cobalt/nickel transport system permease protein